MLVFELVDDWTGHATYYESLDEIPVENELTVRCYPVIFDEDVDNIKSELITFHDGWKKQYPDDILLDKVMNGYKRANKTELIMYKGILFYSNDALVNYLSYNNKLNIIKLKEHNK